MPVESLETIESRLLLEAIYKCYGYDFRSYTLDGIQSRLQSIVKRENLQSISCMIPLLLHDQSFFNKLLKNLLVTVTDFFRAPLSYKALKQTVMPVLSTYPYINVWCAGCATGEEAYSIAILLKEAGLLKRSQIYATDINDKSLAVGKSGIYSLNKLDISSQNYFQAGGETDFSKYYTTKYNAFMMNKDLRERILFSKHNLVNYGVFAEMHLILCRNVCIYFNDKLQAGVFYLLHRSLIRNGYLFMGMNERMDYEPFNSLFKLISESDCVYKKQESDIVKMYSNQ